MITATQAPDGKWWVELQTGDLRHAVKLEASDAFNAVAGAELTLKLWLKQTQRRGL